MSYLVRISILALLVIFPMSLRAQDSTDSETLFNRGEQYLRSGNYSDAIKEFEQAIKLKPEWAEAYFKLGLAHSKVPIMDKDRPAHTKAAVNAFQAAVRLKPTWAEPYNELGLKLLELGKYDDAIGPFKEAIRLQPEFAEAHKNLAIVHLYQDRYTDGIERLREAVRIKPDFAKAHELIGLAYLALDDRDQALQQYNVLKSLDPEMANFLLSAIERPERFTFGVTSGKLISTPTPEYPASAR